MITCESRSKSGSRMALREWGSGPVRMAASAGCRPMTAPTHCAAMARCLAVMDLSPAAASAPAPSTSWHVLELNTYRGTQPYVSRRQEQRGVKHCGQAFMPGSESRPCHGKL